jgi:FkbM family methyltransferase
MNNDIKRDLVKVSRLTSGTSIKKILKNFYRPRAISSKILKFLMISFSSALKIKAKTFWGASMNVIFPEDVSSKIYAYGFFEEGLSMVIAEYLRPGMTFFDVGAHFGYFSLLAAKIVGDHGQVHSFEPTPSTFNVLRENTLKTKNITLNNCAVYSNIGTISLNDYGIQYSSLNSLYEARLSKETLSALHSKSYGVKTIAIDDYVEQAKIKPNFIKIDAESAEYEILCGMKKTIAKYQPIISIEVGDMNINGVKQSIDLIQFLIERDYQAYEYKNHMIIPHVISEKKYSYNNIFFLPASLWRA